MAPFLHSVGKKIIGPYSHVAVTPPALTPDSVLQFILPSQYKEKADIPPPDHPDITIRELPERAVAVYRFSGTVDAARCDKKLRKLRAMLLRDGLLPGPAQGDDGSLDLEHTLTWDVVEYHPKVTLPAFRRNEVWIELPMQGNPAVLRLLTGRTVPGAESEPAPGAEPAEGSGELELPMKQEQPLGEKRMVSFDLSADREEDQAEHKDTIVIKEPMLPTSWKESAVPAVVYQED